MRTPLLSPLGGIPLPLYGTLPVSCDSHDPETLNATRLRVLGSSTGDRVDIVQDRASFLASFREFAPNPPGRFKYMVTELFDGSFQLRVSASLDAGAGLDWSCEHPMLFLGAELMAKHGLPKMFEEKIVAAGFMKIRSERILVDGQSGNCPTDTYSVSAPGSINRSPLAGLKTTARLMQTIFSEYSLYIKDGDFISIDKYLAQP